MKILKTIDVAKEQPIVIIIVAAVASCDGFVSVCV